MAKKRTNENMPQATHHSSSPHQADIENKLIENIVELQKVHTALLEKFDKLSDQLANLLGLFEVAARSFNEHPANQVAEKDKEFLDKVDKLLEQNKTIAKGLTLVEERIRERMYGIVGGRPQQGMQESQSEEMQSQSNQTKPLPRF